MEIVKNDVSHVEHQSHRTVRINEQYEITNQVHEVYAFIGDHGVKITRMSDNSKSKSFTLTDVEMDNLCSAYLNYKLDREHAKATEIIRLSDVKNEAFRLAEYCTALTIEEEHNENNDQTVWSVSIPEIWFHKNTFSPDRLLEEAQNAFAQYEEHLELKAKTKELAKAHPQILVREKTHDGGGKSWQVSVFGTTQEWFNLSTIKEVLRYTEFAVQWLEEHPKFKLDADVCSTLKGCPQITISRIPVKGGWHITIPDLYDTNVDASEELLHAIAEAKELYEQFKRASEQQPASAE